MTPDTSAVDRSSAPPGKSPGSAFVWEEFPSITSRPVRRRIVAAARKASLVAAGTAAELWPLYRDRDDRNDGARPLAVEHAVIGLWGTHQQGCRERNAHAAGVDFGGAARRLFMTRYPQARSPKETHGDDFVTKRLAAVGRSRSWDVAAKQMASLARTFDDGVACDYTSLYWALMGWDDQERRARTLARWARSFHRAGEFHHGLDNATATEQDAGR